jgi:hypothetical protein
MERDEELIMAAAKITYPDCALCGEPFMNHSSTGQCLIEVTGIRSAHYEPMSREDYLEREGKI